ncbi:hypothetical protein C0995_013575, partial [Termitomyces sp. Mi166
MANLLQEAGNEGSIGEGPSKKKRAPPQKKKASKLKSEKKISPAMSDRIEGIAEPTKQSCKRPIALGNNANDGGVLCSANQISKSSALGK